MRRETVVRVGSALLLAAAMSGLGLEAYSRARRFPTPAPRSRANDTPAVDHAAGGGPYGGQVTSLAVARTRPATAYLSLRGGGVYRSTDRGASWQPADRGLPSTADCILTADPVDGDTLYAACYEAGLFKTIDGGALWRQLDLDNPNALVIAAADPRVLYDGILRSRDGGRRWSVVASAGQWPNCRGALVIDSRDAETLFCATEDGLMASRNGGERWALRPGPAGVEPSALVAVPGATDRLLASTGDGHVYAITNHGTTWTRLGHVPGGGVSHLRCDDSGTIVYGTQGDHLVRSADAGRTWSVLPAAWPPHPVWTHAFDPRDPQVLYVGTWDGPFVSLDGGYTWQPSARGLTRASATAIVVHEGPRPALLAAVGPDVLTSDDQGTTWSTVQDAAFPDHIEARSLTSDGAGGARLRAGSRTFQLRAGATAWVEDEAPQPARAMVRPATRPGAGTRGGATVQFDFTLDGVTWQTATSPSGVTPTAVVSVGSDPRHLIAAIGGLPALVKGARSSLWRSLDGGASWTVALAPDVGLVAHCCALFRDPHEADRVYAVLSGMVVGGGGAQLLRSVDAGVSWADAGMFEQAVSVLPTRPTTLLGHPYGRGLVRSTDGGATWRPSDSGLPPGVAVTDVAFNRGRPTTIFAAVASRGIFRSEDAGVSWTPTGY